MASPASQRADAILRRVSQTNSTHRARAWRIFDELVARRVKVPVGNPWHQDGVDLVYVPDYELLCSLLAVPIRLRATTQSGVPALALDVWVAYELRRAGLEADEVWPRTEAPRMVPREITKLLNKLPQGEQRALAARLRKGMKDVVSSEAKLLGKNYVKQVDVVMSAWHTGPQLMISTKRMDKALGKNAANRVEESYGDAKNLRSRYPRSALGFVYSLRAAALDREPKKADWLIDLLQKLGQEDDAYDAVALLLPEIASAPPQGGAGAQDDEVEDEDDSNPLEDAGLEPEEEEGGAPAELTAQEVEETIQSLPAVTLRQGPVPPDLDAGRFLKIMIERVLNNSPINYHESARKLYWHPAKL